MMTDTEMKEAYRLSFPIPSYSKEILEAWKAHMEITEWLYRWCAEQEKEEEKIND